MALNHGKTTATVCSTSTPTQEQISNEEIVLNLEEADGFMDQIDELMKLTEDDFTDNDNSPAALRAAEITRAKITAGTRTGHERIIKAFLTYWLKRDINWDAKSVSERTPFEITAFITQKCGETSAGFEGRKFATAVSTRAALTLWFRSLRPNDGDEWRFDEAQGRWRGLPTRSRHVSEYMIGLEKIKAKGGEVSQSARALTVGDMHRLYDHCMRSDQTEAERRWGIMRWNAYLHAFLMMLRIDEVLKFSFENLEIIPGETEYYDAYLGTRKSAQTGILHGWRLYANDLDPKLCPMRSSILMASLYGPMFDYTGCLFRRIDRSGAVLSQPMTVGVLSRALTADLQAIGYKSWALYGTHSFRRGGCQYRIKVKGWTVDMVAAWGGWSQQEAITMFRYFYSPNDNHEFMVDYDRNIPKRPRVQCF